MKVLRVKFESLKDYCEAHLLNRTKWMRSLREADFAVLAKADPNFYAVALQSMSKTAFHRIVEKKRLFEPSYDKALRRALAIEFDPYGVVLENSIKPENI